MKKTPKKTKKTKKGGAYRYIKDVGSGGQGFVKRYNKNIKNNTHSVAVKIYKNESLKEEKNLLEKIKHIPGIIQIHNNIVIDGYEKNKILVTELLQQSLYEFIEKKRAKFHSNITINNNNSVNTVPYNTGENTGPTTMNSINGLEENLLKVLENSENKNTVSGNLGFNKNRKANKSKKPKEKEVYENIGSLNINIIFEYALYVLQILEILKDLSCTLYQMHKLNIVHYDLKPQNIMLTDKKQPKLIDFGSSRYIQKKVHNENNENIIDPLLGTTYQYVAPEIAGHISGNSNWKSDDITTKVDCYSLGMILFRALEFKNVYSFTNPWPYIFTSAELFHKKKTVNNLKEDGTALSFSKLNYLDVLDSGSELKTEIEELFIGMTLVDYEMRLPMDEINARLNNIILSLRRILGEEHKLYYESICHLEL